LHRNALGGRAPPGFAGEAIALPRPQSRYKGKEREGGERKGLGIGREKGREGLEGVRDGKGERGRGGGRKRKGGRG